ncbi:hypothetical protein DPMN_172986 [Dreissena polymorpha]|uniref:Uncharacterized protein n=1 Tax=Dreissena polymorpha TaxID=45954 RepID=A0A9D4E3U4_DREPO|nr:hypothetical protein DPMN_172986 [Dreissena polymorpha]
MATAQPTLHDVMSLLEGIGGRLSAVEHQLQCLDAMDHRMAVLENWRHENSVVGS